MCQLYTACRDGHCGNGRDDDYAPTWTDATRLDPDHQLPPVRLGLQLVVTLGARVVRLVIKSVMLLYELETSGVCCTNCADT